MSEYVLVQRQIPEFVAPPEVRALIAKLRGDIPTKLRLLFSACEPSESRAAQLKELVNGVEHMSYDDYRELIQLIKTARSAESKRKTAEVSPDGLLSPLVVPAVQQKHLTLLPIVQALLDVRSSLPTLAPEPESSPEESFLSHALMLARLVFPAAMNVLVAEGRVGASHEASHPSEIRVGVQMNEPLLTVTISPKTDDGFAVSARWVQDEQEKQVETSVPKEGAFLIGRRLHCHSLLGVAFAEALEVPVQCKVNSTHISRGGIMVVHTDDRRYIYDCGSQNKVWVPEQSGKGIVCFDPRDDMSEIIEVGPDDERGGGEKE